ncbi:MAG: pyruvate:ferredoxin (flavodoxin) oxidoreductase [Clostridia bacterium]|nr:pyruvate:ferredoxin (flavodoxin) oxidoreductase [Clostridia bacterium]
MKKYITTDGNTAAASSAYALSEMAFIYPITPSSPMAENVDAWASAGKKNVFGTEVNLTEMQSEAGAAEALHGALTEGSLATTFTSSQGLLLMIPNMYKIAGELLPCVIHVAARTVATHALSIFGDHSDVMACRQTGFAMLASSNVQEAQDLALISHIASLKSSVPFLHFFDGFRTSHEINTIEKLSDEDYKALTPFDAVASFKARALTPANPAQRGTAQNEDVFFQTREAANTFYSAIPSILNQTFKDFYKQTGRKYSTFEYFGSPDAKYVTVAMGSGCDTLIKTCEALNKAGEKVGVIKVRLYRPFDTKAFVKCIPSSAEVISVLDRTKESGSVFEPLALDVISALAESGINIPVLGGRYGLSSKEFNPSHAFAVFANMAKKNPKNHFTVGINDDVSLTSLPVTKHINLEDNSAITCKFFGLGSDGTVSANKNTVKIIGEEANLFAQAYFVYDSKKSGSLTTSHMRLSKNPIVAPYLVENCDFIACHNKSFLTKFDLLAGIEKNGTFLLNAPWTDREIEQNLPANIKKEIAENKLKFFVIDAESLAEKVGLNRRINLIMQTAFFALANIFPVDKAIEYIKASAMKTYAKKGEKVLQMNMTAIDESLANLRQINYPSSWKDEKAQNIKPLSSDPYYLNYIHQIETLKGNDLPVSAMDPTGEVPTGTSKLEKRNVATSLPCWVSENCIQCNQCAFVCPHSCIRPHLVKSGSQESAKTGAIPALGVPGYDFKIQISPADCTGCENCAHVCPAKNKALVMKKAEEIFEDENKKYNILKDIPYVPTIFKKETIKGSQFEKPLFEFSGACAGCGETPYIKLLTQLYGKNLIIANATGCSSIYGGSSPTCPYTKDSSGHGPAWANSLFEDNAEFGLGIKKANDNNRKMLENYVQNALENNEVSSPLKNLLNTWLSADKKDDRLADQIREVLKKEIKINPNAIIKNLYSLGASFSDSTVWIIGGDGWAYDIGFGGLDHVLHSNEKVRVLVLDTELYSNTGGQASKATPMGSTAKFATSGKKTHKKDLGAIAMNYPNIYVASISMGASMQQTITALKEAEEFDGPALVIAYCPCINHGADMSQSQAEEKNAVLSGYWNLYRYSTKTGLILDPPFANASYQEFIKTQSRYFNLAKTNPEQAERLFSCAESYAKNRLIKYTKLAKKD